MRIYHLHRLNSDTSYAFVLHSALHAALELSDNWGRRRLQFIVDNQLGLSRERIQTFYSKGDFEIFDVAFVSDNTDFEKIFGKLNETVGKNFVIICSSHNTEAIIKAADVLRSFTSRNTLMIACQEFPSSLLNVTMTPDFQMTLLLPANITENSHTISNAPLLAIYDVFRSPVDGETMRWVQFAEWHFQRRLFIFEDFRWEDQSRKLGGRVLRNMAFTIKPYSMVYTTADKYATAYGFASDVIHAILTNMNGSIRTHKIEFGWGQKFFNGTYDGLIGRFEKKECDVSSTAMHLTAQRKQAVRYVGILAPCQLDLIYATPPSTIPPTTYVLPFDLQVWVVVFLTVLVVVFLLGVAAAFSPRHSDDDPPHDHFRQDSLKFRIFTGTYFVEALDDPTGLTARIIYATLVVAVLMIFTYYNTLLTSFLSYQQQQMPIRNLRDLVERKDFFPLLLNRSAQLEVMKAAPGGDFAAIWRRTSQCGRACIATSDIDFLYMFPRRRYVFLSDHSSVMAYIDQCSNTVIGTGYLKDMYYIVSSKDFPYSRIMYKAMLRLHEGGVVKRFKSKYLKNSKEICTTEMSISSFGFEQTVGLFVVLGIGFLVAFLALFSEIRIDSRQS